MRTLNKNQNYNHPAIEVFEGISAYLNFIRELGGSGLDCSEKSLEIVGAWGKDGVKAGRFSSGLINHFKKCRDCSISKDQQQIVCGEGNQKARIAIVGGVASADDMKKAKPYSGKAGDLLNKILSAMGLTRDQVYITRAVKCCIPENQTPSIADVNVCRAYLEKELKMVKPYIICAFGETAAMSILETSVPLSRLRGRFHDYKGMKVMPTYSPEYLIENTDAKRIVWEDLKLVIGEIKRTCYPLRSS